MVCRERHENGKETSCVRLACRIAGQEETCAVIARASESAPAGKRRPDTNATAAAAKIRQQMPAGPTVTLTDARDGWEAAISRFFRGKSYGRRRNRSCRDR